MYVKTFSFVLLFTISAYNVLGQSQAPWTQCSESDLSNPLNAYNVQIFVSDCRSTDTVCPLKRGTSHTFTAKFTPNTTCSTSTSTNNCLERLIVADMTLRGRSVEVPYGGVVPACNTTYKDSDGSNCERSALTPYTQYTHETIFPVFANVPKTSLTVRYMIRAASPRVRTRTRSSRRRQSNWRTHDGVYYVCAEIPVTLV